MLFRSDVEATGIGLDTLLGLMMKQILMNRLETVPQISEAIALPLHIVEELVMYILVLISAMTKRWQNTVKNTPELMSTNSYI